MAWGHLDGLARMVERRLDKGEEEYGPAQFFQADIPHELSEEAADLLGWGYLEFTKLQYRSQEDPNDTLDEAFQCLATIAACGAQAFGEIQRYRELVGEPDRTPRPLVREADATKEAA